MLESLKTHKVLKAQIALFAPYLQSQITELISNTENELWLYKLDGTRQKIHDSTFSKEFLLRFCEQLANYRDLPFDTQAPTLNCSIPFTRYRVSANHFSITTNNQISLNIRVPSLQKFPLEAFALAPTCPFSHADLKSMAQEGHNILISGATASGKTSLLNALLESIPKEERVVSVEDSQELDLSGFENSVGLLVGKIEQTPFTYENALNMAMRMRPDRLMVGEIDTRNALLFLRFGNTGHKGMMTTLHANSVEQVLEAIALNIEMGHKAKFDLGIVKRYFKSAIDVVIQVCKIQEQRHINQVLLSRNL
ncbi:CpaF/VirB11 family protein [Helicobacter ailurogastricus]|uniref:ATPase required for both assembly of type IV secretion complex and secretion of T-DNA complex, VirB11 n=1 Tax=Helicobacter ailurogastricus TaxID=1578720 RepID=A0A0K2Y763_9HELI|nr:type II/IV secretion system ATPase subunit [Helicobacter ailurogastricus]BDQ28450.1 conjugal transfer protein TrbB [Helicobacter ailurogastricus]CRF52985.1 ATPase required for both assembly of type IV secretion complex and secretion of T-DNA complex, VirB11 [Helicobacter ailurogastricus]